MSSKTKDWILRVEDILKAIDKIDRYLKKIMLSQFKKNELGIDAVVRNFEIIVEASKNIPLTIRRDYPDIPWEQMSGMRNILIHEYSRADTKIVWHTAKKYLPNLRKQLQILSRDLKK